MCAKSISNFGIEVEHARARGCGERPDGRALLVGPEQAAERRRDAAHGGIHERERLTREALQILEPLSAASAAAGERDLRDRRRDRRFVGLCDEPYARARVRARRRRLRLALRDRGSLLLRGELLDHLRQPRVLRRRRRLGRRDRRHRATTRARAPLRASSRPRRRSSLR